MIKKGIQLDKDRKELNIQYPFVKNPSCLTDNRSTALKIASRMEARLRKEGQLAAYRMEFQKFLQRGAVREVSIEELSKYEGPKSYISHHPVYKSDSGSTPLRIVANSSLANAGTTLNECMAKGPNSLNDGMTVLLRFRSYEVAFTCDISKAYQQMKTGDKEMFLRLLI